MQPLASPGTSRLQSNTNLSRSVALSLFDSDGRELATTTDQDHRIEMIIPRDPNVAIPSMALQNVTFIDASPNRQLFNLHFVNITSQLPISLHLEMRPLNPSIAYLFVYRFDSAPQLNSTVNLIDGWTAFCPVSRDGVHTFFVDNQQTLGHQSIIFGLRELNAQQRSPMPAPAPLLPTNECRSSMRDSHSRPTTSSEATPPAVTISMNRISGKAKASWSDR